MLNQKDTKSGLTFGPSRSGIGLNRGGCQQPAVQENVELQKLLLENLELTLLIENTIMSWLKIILFLAQYI